MGPGMRFAGRFALQGGGRTDERPAYTVRGYNSGIARAGRPGERSIRQNEANFWSVV